MIVRLRWIALVGLLGFAGASVGYAQNPGDAHLNGLHLSGSIDDFTTPTFGSWKVGGVWSLDMTGGPNAAEFSAALTMERSDLYFGDNPNANAESLPVRNAHTHNISMVHGAATPIPGGFRVTGLAGETIITGNGGTAPFETNPPSSTLQIDITGGNLVSFSNIALTFGGAAVKHFGSNPIAGAVERVR